VHDDQDFSGEGPAAEILEEPLKELVECFLRTDFLVGTSQALNDIYKYIIFVWGIEIM
jgi:hypothetical protein